VPLGELLPEIPAVRVGPPGRERVRHGRDLGRGDVLSGFPDPHEGRVRILDESGALLALAVPRGAEAAGAPAVAPVLHPDLVLVS
jgi:hypothetical protein